MSFTPRGEESPKRGKELPSARKRSEHAHVIAAALKEELTRGTTIKAIMAWTGAGERTVKGWLAGANCPSGMHLEELLRSSDAVYRRLMIRTGRGINIDRRCLETLKDQIDNLSRTLNEVLA